MLGSVLASRAVLVTYEIHVILCYICIKKYIFREYVSKWCSLIEYEDKSFSIINFLTTPEKLLKWEADGLPLDQSAIKNAVFIDQVIN